MTKRLILPALLLIVVIGLILYVGGTSWVEIEFLDAKPVEITQVGFALSQQAAILIVTAAIVAIILLWSLAVWLWKIPNRVKSGMGRRRETGGIEALEQALLASEAGNEGLARRKAKKAHDLLKRPALTGFVSARAHELAGQVKDAETHYRALLDDSHTAVAGYRGLTRLAEQKGDFAAVKSFAQAASETSPPPPWALQTLFRADVYLSDWDGALAVLDRINKMSLIDPKGIKRRRAAVLSAKASDLDSAGEREDATQTALKATEIDPGYSPAAVLTAKLLNASGNTKRAISVIDKAWRAAPHPALAQAFLDIIQDEPPAAQMKKIKSLVKNNAKHRESSILLAEYDLAQGNGDSAMDDLAPVLKQGEPSARVCQLAASAEALRGNTEEAKAWRARAARAPIEADWSDLDPDGPAFDYTPADWQNLIISYGENGELIHPRFGNAPRRAYKEAVIPEPEPEAKPKPVSAPLKDEAARDAKKPDIKPDEKPEPKPEPKAHSKDATAPSPDNPGVTASLDAKDDLSARLSNLLGDSKTP